MSTLDALVAAERAGTLPPLLFFWSPRSEGWPGPGCLSQWWPAPFERDGHRFATAEHYMMWAWRPTIRTRRAPAGGRA